MLINLDTRGRDCFPIVDDETGSQTTVPYTLSGSREFLCSSYDDDAILQPPTSKISTLLKCLNLFITSFIAATLRVCAYIYIIREY